MVLDKWLNGEEVDFSSKTVINALEELDEEVEKIRDLVYREARYWDAYIRLVACISFFNIAARQHPTKRPSIIERLLNWIQKIKGEIDKIVRGIGGNGYSIGVSAPFGVSISVSFTV